MALHNAAFNRNEATVKLLLSKLTDMRAMESSRATTLQSTARIRYEYEVRPLPNSGVDVDARTQAKETAIHIALEMGHKDTRAQCTYY